MLALSDRNSFTAKIEALERELEKIRLENDERMKTIESKEQSIVELKEQIANFTEQQKNSVAEIDKLRKQFKVQKSKLAQSIKRVNQSMFKINLCCFEEITENSIKFETNNVTFTGNIIYFNSSTIIKFVSSIGCDFIKEMFVLSTSTFSLII